MALSLQRALCCCLCAQNCCGDFSERKRKLFLKCTHEVQRPKRHRKLNDCGRLFLFFNTMGSVSVSNWTQLDLRLTEKIICFVKIHHKIPTKSMEKTKQNKINITSRMLVVMLDTVANSCYFATAADVISSKSFNSYSGT